MRGRFSRGNPALFFERLLDVARYIFDKDRNQSA